MKIAITGGRGFIGSHMVMGFSKAYPKSQIIIVDALTYAAREPLWTKRPENVKFIKMDIRDQLIVRRFMEQERPDHIIHLAAESHVCRSISGPKDFITTNINGTWNLLEEFKEVWKHETKNHRFVHFSTDEVFGQINKGKFNERSQIAPRSPYASSKAASDLIVSSYHETYGTNATIVNCSNNFGPNQHEEKLIPKAITNVLTGAAVTVYGTGKQVRDWVFVEDVVQATLKVFQKGEPGQRYCIGGENELTNLQVIDEVFNIITTLWPREGYELKLEYTNDRPTDDLRYAVETTKVRKLGWKPNSKSFTDNLQYTILWYYRKLIEKSKGSSHGRGD